MFAKRAVFCSPIFVLFTLVFSGCTRVADRYPQIVVQSENEFVYTHRYTTLMTVRTDGSDPRALTTSETTIIVPRVSPRGDKVAFYDVGASGVPVSSARVALAVVRTDGASVEESRPLSFYLPQFDVDRRMMIDDVIAPLWDPEGESLIVPHDRGIERVALSGERTSLVDGVAVTAVALSPDGKTIAYADAGSIHVLDRLGDGRETLLGEDVLPRFGNRRVRALAYSPDGRRLVFGAGHEVLILDVVSKTVHRVFEAPHGVYWLSWLPNGKEIALLHGREDHRRGLHSPWGADNSGKYALAVIGEDGDNRRELYSAHLIDVRHATPDLSPDGRYVSLTVMNGAAKEIALVATDGSGAVVITSSGPNSYASWRRFP